MITKVILTEQELNDWLEECDNFEDFPYVKKSVEQTPIKIPCVIVYDLISHNYYEVNYTVFGLEDLNKFTRLMSESVAH